jgi:hypothetical protein
MLTITLSELMSDVQVTQVRMDGVLEKCGEAQRLQKSLLQALDAATEHALMVCISNSFIYVDIAKLKFL